MNWPAYSDYGSSQLPWIGAVPAHWRIAPNRALLDLRRDPVGKKSGEYPLLSLTLRGVILRDVSENKGKFPVEFDTYQAVDPGNLVFCLFDIEETPRTVGLAKNRGMVTGAYDVFRVRKGVDGRYVEYLYLALDEKKSLSYFYSGLRKVIRMPTFKSIRCPVPPLPEQAAIADFLDAETSKIDALIAKQGQLIATLREDRAATITHAVTEGLDVSVEMKGSGVEWLGEMPRHWLASRLKNVIGSTESGTSVNAGDWPAGADDIGVLKTSCVSAGWFNPAANKTVVDQSEIDRATCPVKADSLIVNRANTPQLVGSAGYAEVGHKNLFLSDKLWQGRFNGTLGRFIYYWTQTQVYRSQITALCVGASSSMQNLAMTDFRNVAVALPPLDEQAAIVSFLSTRTSTIDDLIEKALSVIKVLQEYRAALITDAVTGKIDVRGAVA